MVPLAAAAQAGTAGIAAAAAGCSVGAAVGSAGEGGKTMRWQRRYSGWWRSGGRDLPRVKSPRTIGLPSGHRSLFPPHCFGSARSAARAGRGAYLISTSLPVAASFTTRRTHGGGVMGRRSCARISSCLVVVVVVVGCMYLIAEPAHSRAHRLLLHFEGVNPAIIATALALRAGVVLLGRRGGRGDHGAVCDWRRDGSGGGSGGGDARHGEWWLVQRVRVVVVRV